MLLWWNMVYDLPLSCPWCEDVSAQKQPAITWPMTTKSSSSWVSSAIWQRSDRKWSTVMLVQHGLRFGPKSHLQPSRAYCWMSCSASSSSRWSMGTLFIQVALSNSSLHYLSCCWFLMFLTVIFLKAVIFLGWAKVVIYLRLVKDRCCWWALLVYTDCSIECFYVITLYSIIKWVGLTDGATLIVLRFVEVVFNELEKNVGVCRIEEVAISSKQVEDFCNSRSHLKFGVWTKRGYCHGD